MSAYIVNNFKMHYSLAKFVAKKKRKFFFSEICIMTIIES